MFRDLNDIRLFAEVARHGAVTRGAEALGMPVATVSRRLAALEREVGERLIERNARRFRLTDTGVAYLTAATRVLEDLDAASSEMSRIVGTPSGQLHIAAPPDFATFFLSAPVADFCERYPAITVSMDLSPRRVDLINEGFDLAVRMGRLLDSRLVSRRLTRLERGLYVGRDHLERHGAPQRPEDLDSGRLLLLESDFAQGELTLRRGGELRAFEVQSHLNVNSVAMLRELTLVGAGIALLPGALVARELAEGSVVHLLPDWQATPIEAHLLYRGRALLPQRVRLMVEHLGAWFQMAAQAGDASAQP
jgi:DNA-binding transcriptional LysR family regulator